MKPALCSPAGKPQHDAAGRRATTADAGGRANQLRRTRKDLLQAAARMAREGRSPSLEEVAEAAMVSRATAYRHFPDVNALLIEAALDIDTPRPSWFSVMRRRTTPWPGWSRWTQRWKP